MRAGRLNKRAQFQTRATTQVAGGPGDQSTAWTNTFSDWVELVAFKSHELPGVEDTTRNVAFWHCSMRYRAQLTAEMRMVIGSRVFSILSRPYNVDMRNRELTFQVSEGLDQQDA